MTETIKKNLICCSSREVNFGEKSEILCQHFCATTKPRTQPDILANYQKSLIFPDWNDLHV